MEREESEEHKFTLSAVDKLLCIPRPYLPNRKLLLFISLGKTLCF